MIVIRISGKTVLGKVSDVNRLILTACKLSDLWVNGSFKFRLNLQKTVFPSGVIWDKETENLEPSSKTKCFSICAVYQVVMKMQIKKTGKTFDFSGLVDYYDIISNLFEDIKKVERFAQLLPAAEVIILNC